MLLVQATGGLAPLVWAKGSRRLSATWGLLCDLQVAGMDIDSLLRGQREKCGLPPLGACEWAPPAAPVTSGVGKIRGHCNQATHVIALTPLGIQPPCSCHCQMLWAAPTCLITVHSQDPTIRISWYSTSCTG